MTSSKDRERIQNQFDTYYRKVIRNEVYGIYRQSQRKQKYEVSLSSLYFDYDANIATTDEYPLLQYEFCVCGKFITINDYYLGEALTRLPEQKWDTLLMYYGLGMRQHEIAKLFGKVRQTISKRNISALKILKKELELLYEKT